MNSYLYRSEILRPSLHPAIACRIDAWCAGRAPCGRTRALAEVGRSQSPRVRHARVLLKRHSGGAAHPTDDGAPSSVGCARTVQSSRR
jgi:hypothetical protein